MHGFADRTAGASFTKRILNHPWFSMQRPAFIFTTCQIGAELALKRELTRRYPGFKPAFARPGFVTFKLPPNHNLMLDWRLDAVFARCWGYSLGPVEADPAALPE